MEGAQRPVNRISSRSTIVVTGANGWMGKEFIHNWKLRENDARIIPAPRLGPNSVEILAADLAGQEDWTLVHLAFVTRERLSTMHVDSYISANRAITESVQELILKFRPTAVVHASSGAVFKPDDIYGQLKLEQEEILRTACDHLQIPCVNARIWSVTGAFCPKPRNFLFFDLLYQALFEEEIHISAKHEVLRRYVDAGQFLSVANALAQLGISMDLDSGGGLVSAAYLGQRILGLMDSGKSLVQEVHDGPSDHYFSRSNSMENMARVVGVDLGDLDWQIRNSISAFGGIE